ncbi:glycosyltransferase [Sphingobacterium sp. DK4209]|uniref:Glycosyltransferase n=1 Tax=Sphingobacterium zhuxiongii TaxID=2662364 RepID=A0A5Q0QBY4_9SPHI|nr:MULTISPECIES: glycosyltransferase [unclassified Sphingobacterium]MVZ65291.1 glycosyltransferase [Sphingobacterium sp. DK4209]QGA26381.1 glycosyltransferase [Sphingobacterium sp. dk4302]
MKILQLGKFYPIRGGVEKVMYDLMLGLSGRGITCDMLCATTEDHPGGTIALNDYATLMVIPTQINLAATKLAPKMIRTLRKIAKNYDIIHVHHPDPMAALALYLSGYKGPVVLHWHSDILKQKNLLKLYKPLQEWLIRRANIIVGTTPVYVQQSPFLKEYQSKIDYIPIGISPLAADMDNALRIREKYHGKRIIFSLGRLVEYKGFEYLIKSAEQLDDSSIILIGGKGPLHDELNQLIQDRKLGDKVKLLGFLSDEEVPDYFAASDLFCMSSIMKTEAFGIVQLESMASGKPIVSTEIPTSGVSWVNENNVSGLTVPIENTEAIAQAIKKMLENPAFYEQLREGSLTRYQANFTLDNMVDKSLQIYNQILSNYKV